MLVETFEHLHVARKRGGPIVYHDHVESGQQVLLLAKRLSYDSLYSVACGRPPAVLFRYSQTEPGGFAVVFPAQHGKQVVSAACCPVEYAAESGRIKEPVFFRKPIARAARQSWNGARRRDGRRRLTASAGRGLWRGGA